MRADKTLTLFSYEWDAIQFKRLSHRWPQTESGFDLFSFPSNARLAWFDMERFTDLAVLRCKAMGVKAVVSNQEQFGALCAALTAEKLGLPGTSVESVLACQHKLYAREILQRVAPEANIPAVRLQAKYGGDIPEGLQYPAFVKPVKAAFSVLAAQVNNREDLYRHTRFGAWELWVIRHLVEPFDRIARKRLPEAGTAHSLMLEEPRRGKQYSLDGYCYFGQFRTLGVVDSVMYPGTNAFMRFDYPSHLTAKGQERAADVARRFLNAVGFTHGLFNMEFFYDEATEQIQVIEFNPRLASQFSDLYQRVNGIDLHEYALALGHGIDPETLPRQVPSAQIASSIVYRSFCPDMPVNMPTQQQMNQVKLAFPDHLLFVYPKLKGQIERDFKWLQSYRYGIVHLGGDSPDDLKARGIEISRLLGWTAPWVQAADQLPGLQEAARKHALGAENGAWTA